MTDFRTLLGVLTTAHTEFIVVGGAAATAHGSAIHVKRAAGRIKDLEVIAELEAIAEERHRQLE